MSWNIFRNKSFKALDTIYRNYEKIYDSYREFADSDNDFFHHQAEIIRGELMQVGAMFDHVIAQEGPQFLAKVQKEFGYIPYTATCVKHYGYDESTEEFEQVAAQNKALRRLRSLSIRYKHGKNSNSPLGKKLHKRTLKATVEEASKFNDLISECKALGCLDDEAFATRWDYLQDVTILGVAAYLPRSKYIPSFK